MRIGYLDCFSGASGDMILGALLDCGWPEEALRALCAGVPLGGYELNVARVRKGPLMATQVRIRVTEPQPERHLAEVLDIVERSGLSPAQRSTATRLFRRLAEVEAAIHGSTPEQIHFHEVGAVDSIIDILGAVAGLAALRIEQLYVSPVNVGGGTVRTAHGELPVPAPATAALMRGRPVYSSGPEGELLTPTGALILSELAAGFGPLPPMQLECIGYGAGQKDLPRPNVLRLMAGAALAAPAPAGTLVADAARTLGADYDTAVRLETNIDDMNPQLYGHLVELLYAAGALDVTLLPAQMKKGRPGTLLSVLAPEDAVAPLAQVLFTETTTIGIRLQRVERLKLGRSVETVSTRFGPIRVKISRLAGQVVNAMPEYEDCRAAALARRVPLKQVLDEARRAWEQHSRGEAV
jgi:uncharacterized protein (TIGR00299 family) protein